MKIGIATPILSALLSQDSQKIRLRERACNYRIHLKEK